MLNILLPNRGDALGSNFVVKLGAFIYGKIKNMNIFYEQFSKGGEWGTPAFRPDSMFMEPFYKFCNEKDKKLKYIDYHDDGRGGNLRMQQAAPVVELKQDIISYFNKNHKEDFYKIIEGIAIKRNYQLPWKDNKKIICIHLRMGDNAWYDGTSMEDYDGRASGNYIKDLIEKDMIKLYSKQEMFKKSHEYYRKNNIKIRNNSLPDRQCCISIKKLENFIIKFKKDFPDKEIHVVSLFTNCPKHRKYKQLCNRYKCKLHSNKDIDYDLWLLINSEILVLSKSTYSLIAGYYHQGNKVYYPVWGTFVSTGLYTKYDVSGWEYYI